MITVNQNQEKTLVLVDCYNQILLTLCSQTVHHAFTDRYCKPFAKGFKQVCKTYPYTLNII